MGVRLADTMTTLGLGMLEPLWSETVLTRQRGGRLAGAAPCAAAGRAFGGGRARAQSVLEYGDERLRDLGARHGLILPVPVRDPIERTGEGKGGHFRIARQDRAVLNAVTDQAADSLVDLRFERLDMPAHGGRQVLVLRPHHAPAELRGDGLAVVAQHRLQPLARRHIQAPHLAEGRPDLLDARHKALKKQLLLAGDVIIYGRLGDLEGGGDVIERGVVVTLAVEGVGRGPYDRLALDFAVAQPLAARPPGRRALRVVGGYCGAGCSAAAHLHARDAATRHYTGYTGCVLQ